MTGGCFALFLDSDETRFSSGQLSRWDIGKKLQPTDLRRISISIHQIRIFNSSSGRDELKIARKSSPRRSRPGRRSLDRPSCQRRPRQSGGLGRVEKVRPVQGGLERVQNMLLRTRQGRCSFVILPKLKLQVLSVSGREGWLWLEVQPHLRLHRHRARPEVLRRMLCQVWSDNAQEVLEQRLLQVRPP